MKDLQNRIQQMLADRKNHIRVISMVTALSLLVMIIAPMLLVSPGISLTKNSYSPVKLGNTIVKAYDGSTPISTQINNSYKQNGVSTGANEVNGKIYSPASVSLKTLLFGDGTGTNWLKGDETLDQALAKAEDEYFLGLASDFCAFINEDFTAFEADAEGRMAVGGNLSFKGEWNYQIGSGDYASVTPLTDTDEYSGEDNQRRNFAHVLCGGKLYRVNTIGTGNKEYNQNHPEWHFKDGQYVSTVVYDPEHDMYKKLFVDTVSGSECWGTNGDQAYSESFSTECPGSDANCNHTYLENVNQLAQIYHSDTIKVQDIIKKVYEDIKKRSSLLSKIKGIAGHVEGSTVIFDGAGAEGNTVYFTLDEWGEGTDAPNINQVEFVNIPGNANIVVNVGGQDFNIYGDHGNNRIVKTFINGIEISQTGDIKTNNNKESGRILYNFYEATKGKIQCNFNGTVLSPLANVTTPPTSDNKCPGHLSGALIANSHWGYIEFGYRPYRGGSEILGLTSGYVVPVDKFIEGTEDTHLPGARFTIQKIEDGVPSTVGGWVSGDSTKYAPLPFTVDFSGDTNYSAVKTYLDAQNGSNDTQSNNVNRFSKKALVDALGGGFKADEDDDAETTTVETEETTSADTTAIETETTAAETTAAEETTAITSAADETTSSETETTEVAETTVSEVTEPVTEAEVQDETDIPDEETEVVDEELADVQNIQNFEILADDDQSETDPPETTPANVFQSLFTIKESNPPEGFFKTDKQYTVDITETIKGMIEKAGKYYPNNVDVDVNISGVNYSYQSRFNIADTRNALDMVENRVITIDDVQFTLTIEDHKATAVKVGSEDITPTERVINYNNKKYYFDPEYMMVIPLPAKNLKFENEPGLYFKKVDDKGNSVTGATITLVPTISGWKQGDLIKLSDIRENTVYTFTETYVPPGYEQAEPIHFRRTGNYTIEYWTGNETPQPRDLRENGKQIIEMVDKRILGAKLKILKYRQAAEDTEVQLDGAKFSLYAEDGTLLKPNIDADNEQIDLTEITDTTYVENGYLKPGIYYLKETKTPESDGDPYEYPGKLYFVVNNDFTVKAYTAPIALGIYKPDDYSRSFTLTDNNVVKHIVSDEGQTDKITIENVTSINVKCDKTIEQAYVGAVAGEGFAKNPYDKDELNLSFNPPIEVNNLKVMANNLIVTYAEIQTSDGTRYVYPAPDPNSAITASDLLSKGETDNGVQTLNVKNEKQGAKKDVTVTKKWKNDEGFEGLRSDVTVKLYRSTVELSEDQLATELDKTENSKLTPYTPDGSDGTAILNSANNWTYKWENLPAYSDDDGSKEFYYYYVKEISTHSAYTTTYQVEGNDLTVVNTLNTINIKAEKRWDYPEGTIELPPSITFMLQMRDGSNWVDVPEKKITLTADDSWKGEFKNLPAGKQYQMKEVNVPTGWISAGSTDVADQDGDTLSITNTADLSRLNLHKDWDENGSGSVDSVKVELYRKEQSLWPENQTPAEVAADYARLLQYSLYFYDANMCGDQVNENSNYKWRSDCHTEDEVKGGFHDAGDHVMFGLPQGFTASTLGWSYYEFKNSFDSLGQTEHYKIIAKYFADFFYNAVKTENDSNDSNANITSILVQKGNARTDHNYWGAPEAQDSRQNEMYWADDKCVDIAAEYAATLAQYALNFPDDPDSENYRERAKKLYEFAQAKYTPNDPNNHGQYNVEDVNCEPNGGGYYRSSDCSDDLAWARAWLYLATNRDSNYNLNDTSISLNSEWNTHCWDNVGLGAAILIGEIKGSWDTASGWLNNNCSNPNDFFYVAKWGSNRYNCGAQLAALVYAKHNPNESDKYKNWAKSQMDYILGAKAVNSSVPAKCYVVGFSENSPINPHHRAASADLSAEVKDDEYNNQYAVIGALVGGPSNKSDANNGRPATYYDDVRSDYTANEVSLDYNAVLVGAAAGLYSYFRTGATYEIPGVKNQYPPATSTGQEDQPEDTANGVNPAVSMANAGKAVATTVRKLYKTGVDTNIAASTGTKTRALRLGKAEKLAGSLDSIAGVIGPRVMAASHSTPWKENETDKYIYLENPEFNQVYPTGLDKKVNKLYAYVTFNQGSANNAGYNLYIECDGLYSPFQISSANGAVETNANPVTVISQIKVKTIDNKWNFADDTTVTVNEVRLYYDDSNEVPSGPTIEVTNADDLSVGDTFNVSVSNASNPGWFMMNDSDSFSNIFERQGDGTNPYTFKAKKAGNFTIYIKDYNNGNEESNKVTITVSEQPTFNITPSSDYVTSNGQFTVGVSGTEEPIIWTIKKGNDDCNDKFTISGNTFTVNGAAPGVYIVKGKAGAAEASFEIEVLSSNLTYKVIPNDGNSHDGYQIVIGQEDGKTVNKITVDSVMAGKLKKVAYKFDQNANGDQNFGFGYANGSNTNYSKYYYKNMSGTRLIYAFDCNTNSFDAIKLSEYYNANPHINIDKVYLIYEKGTTFNISPEEPTVVAGERVKLNITDAEGDITWTTSEGTITKEADGYYYTAPGYNSDGNNKYNITGTDSEYKTGSFEINVIDFKLGRDNVNVKKGNTVNIPITYNGENNFTFDPAGSEYFDISVDDNGNVVVRGKQATADPIEVRISRNGYSKTINVNVNNGISINGAKDKIAVNEAIQLEAVNVNGSVTWTSSDSAIATVDDNGKVIGKGFGTVTITATDGGGTATYQIRVEPIPNDAEKVATITIKERDGWTAEVNNLPKVSPNGIPYVYYIKEVDSSQYIPLSYNGNGAKLDGNNVPTITVTNKLTKNLPITGGRGTEKIYMAGGVMMLLAAAAYAMFKRREFGKEE